MIQNILRKFFPIAAIAFMLCLFMTGCAKSAKSEKEIIADLQESPSFFSVGGELTITGCEVTKRRTDADNYSDVIYLDIFASNDDIDCTLSYIMYYELYNDGWILENVEQDYEGQWLIVPLHGMTDEDIQTKLDYYVDTGLYDTIELIDRETDLSEYGCTETVILCGEKEHLYGTETFDLTQTWYFEPLICDYTSVVADPMVTDRSITLKEAIIGNSWSCKRYNRPNVSFMDNFEVSVENLYEKNGDTWIVFTIDREDFHIWGENPVYGVRTEFIVSDFLEYWVEGDKWAFNLEDKNDYLYPEDDNERFTENSWFCFSLDRPGVGYIEETSEIGDRASEGGAL